MLTLEQRVKKLESIIKPDGITLTSPNKLHNVSLIAKNDSAGLIVKSQRHISCVMNVDNEDECYSGLVSYNKLHQETPGLAVVLDDMGKAVVQAPVVGVDIVGVMPLSIIIQAYQNSLAEVNKPRDTKVKTTIK